MHKKSLSETLLTNSQISGVKIVDTCFDLSANGHGLYIESTSGDQYADLRLTQTKPFWGHSHPIEVRELFGQLPTIPNPENIFVYDLKDFEQWAKLENRLVIDEKSFFEKQKLNNFFSQRNSQQDPLTLIFSNTLLFNQSGYFPDIGFDNTNCILVINNLKVAVSNFLIPNLSTIESNLFNVADKYLHSLVWNDGGKLAIDQQHIKQSLSDTQIEVVGRYIVLKLKSNKIDPILTLASAGILIDQDNLSKDQILLCLPLSCTNEELLDTLERIKRVDKEL